MCKHVIKQAEKEYDEPFADIVRGFAEMGYSKSETARILGYKHLNSLIKWIKNNNFQANWRSGFDTESFKQTVSEAKRGKSNAQTKSLRMYHIRHVVTYNGITAPLADHAEQLGLNKSTVWWRRNKYPNKSPEFWLRPTGTVAKNNNLNHPWKK